LKTEDEAMRTKSSAVPRVVGLGGSLRSRSSSLRALEAALAGAAEAGAVVDLLDVRDLDLPLYGRDDEVIPPGAVRLADSVADSDAMIWSSPMYHGTVSGAFKNALDWLQLLADRDPPFLTYKPVGLISTAAGVQGLQAINTMEFVVRALRGWAVPLVIPVARASEALGHDGPVHDPALAARLHELGREVVSAARLFTAERSA
jgi:FMN reductase